MRDESKAKCDVCNKILDFPNWIAQEGTDGLMYKNPKCVCNKCFDKIIISK